MKKNSLRIAQLKQASVNSMSRKELQREFLNGIYVL